MNIDNVIFLQELKQKVINSARSVTESVHKISCSGLQSIRRKFYSEPNADKYGHVFRRKKRWELMMLCAAVCGIEFCYSAETAFVSPILLSLGLKVEYMTMIWCLSPILGFFSTPLLGSLSDSCTSKLGRRRPFIISFSIGMMLGLIIIPNGENIGLAVGDKDEVIGQQLNKTTTINATYVNTTESNEVIRSRPFGITFTVLGTILLDFCSDSCQSPARSYLLDVTVAEDHTRGLSTFTIMAGFGGTVGYVMSAIEWEDTFLAKVLGNHIRTAFIIVTFFFVISVMVTICSFAEIPLEFLREPNKINSQSCSDYQKFVDEEESVSHQMQMLQIHYGTLSNSEQSGNQNLATTTENISEDRKSIDEAFQEYPTAKEYFKSIIRLPKSIQILCLTNLLGWMSLVAYSLYFTNFVGQAVFNGDPQAPEESSNYVKYQNGVKFGCWGMAIYSLSCCGYSFCVERLVKRFGIKPVYVCGQLVFSTGMAMMALFPNRIAVILLSFTAGAMYATLFTIPYILIAQYHCASKFEKEEESRKKQEKEGEKRNKQTRGIGTDVAIASSMLFLAQFILSSCMGSVVRLTGSSVATVCAASVLSLFGAISATQVMYL